MPKILKDLDLGRCAFMEYHGNAIPFEALNADYQMRWVRVARAVSDGHRAYGREARKSKPNGQLGPSEATEKRRAYNRAWYAKKIAKKVK